MTEQPSKMGRLDPAPRAPRRPARVRGDREKAYARDLKALPPALRASGLAAVILDLSRDLDAGGMTPRDKAGHARELRMHWETLAAAAPGERKGDSTDEVRQRRERRMAAAAGD